MKYQIYQTNWSYPNGKDTVSTIKNYCIGSILNCCSGKSSFGDLRIDFDSKLEPDVVADVFHPPIRRQSFDTVILDPPYSYYNKFKWITNLSDIARKRVIISAGQIHIKIKNFKLKDVLVVVTSNLFYARIWYVFDRVNSILV